MAFLLWPVALIALYVLSTGPVVRLVERGSLGEYCLVVYEPLRMVVRGTPLAKALNAYVDLWSKRESPEITP